MGTGPVSQDLFAPTDFMQVRAVLVRELGNDFAAAGVLVRLNWRCNGPDATDGWWRGSYAKLAEETGLTIRQVQRILAKLREEGRIEAEAKAASGHDQTLSYRVTKLPTTPKRVSPAMSDTPDIPETQTDQVPNPNGLWTEPKRVSLPTKTSKTTTKTKAKNLCSTDVERAFVTFWDLYPRKVGKRGAESVFRSALRRAEAETILSGARRLRADPNLPETEFVPHPSTWLNRDGWLDEPYPPRVGAVAHTNGPNGYPAAATPTEKVTDWRARAQDLAARQANNRHHQQQQIGGGTA